MIYPQPIIVESTTEQIKSIIWLHGLGASANDFYSLLPALSIDDVSSYKWIFPNAPEQSVSVNGGMVMPSWFDIVSSFPEFKANETDVIKSSDYINILLQKEAEFLKSVLNSKMSLAGFSQGGVVAIHAGLVAVANEMVDQLSILGLSCCHPHLEKVMNEFSPSQLEILRENVQVCLMHGEHDNVIPVNLGKSCCEILSDYSIPVSWQTYLMGHEVCVDQIKDISKYFNEL